MLIENDEPMHNEAPVTMHADPGEKHEAAATDDDTSNGSERAADKDNPDVENADTEDEGHDVEDTDE